MKNKITLDDVLYNNVDYRYIEAQEESEAYKKWAEGARVITKEDCIEALDNDEQAGTIFYNLLKNESSLYDNPYNNPEYVFDYDSMLDDIEAHENKEERKILLTALRRRRKKKNYIYDCYR